MRILCIYLKDTVDQELNGRVRNANGVEDLVKVVRDETVTGPLREERDGNDDPHALAVAGGREESFPADIGCNCSMVRPMIIHRENESIYLCGRTRGQS